MGKIRQQVHLLLTLQGLRSSKVNLSPKGRAGQSINYTILIYSRHFGQFPSRHSVSAGCSGWGSAQIRSHWPSRLSTDQASITHNPTDFISSVYQHRAETWLPDVTSTVCSQEKQPGKLQVSSERSCTFECHESYVPRKKPADPRDDRNGETGKSCFQS